MLQGPNRSKKTAQSSLNHSVAVCLKQPPCVVNAIDFSCQQMLVWASVCVSQGDHQKCIYLDDVCAQFGFYAYILDIISMILYVNRACASWTSLPLLSLADNQLENGKREATFAPIPPHTNKASAKVPVI